jgi:hypothetical protein
VRRLERPDAPFQPIEERQVVGHSAKEHLAEMDVGLHEARHDGAPARVEDPRRPERCASRTVPDRGNPARANEQIALEGAI